MERCVAGSVWAYLGFVWCWVVSFVHIHIIRKRRKTWFVCGAGGRGGGGGVKRCRRYILDVRDALQQEEEEEEV